MHDSSSSIPDDDCLDEYRRTRSEAAFRQLVRQHISLVWSVARRVTNGDATLAEDVTQVVFTDFARLAPHLPPAMPAGGWLHRHAFFTASKAVRAESRRRAREHLAAAMHNSVSPRSEADDPWPDLAPHVDAALASLSAKDRDVIIQRFLERRSLRDLSCAFETTEDAVRKRVARALERLRDKLRRRGVQVATAGIASSLATHGSEPVADSVAVKTAGAAWAAHTAAGIGGLVRVLSALLVRWGAGRLAVAAGASALVLVAGLVWLWRGAGLRADRLASSRTVTHITRPSAPRTNVGVNGPMRAELALYLLPDRDVALRLLRFHPGVDDVTLFKELGPPESGGGKRWQVELTAGGHGSVREVNPRKYPTEFEYDRSGNPSGTAEVTRLVGTIAVLSVTDDPQGEFSIVDFTFEHHLTPPTLQLWPVSLIQGPDRPDLGPTQPVFRVLSLEGSLAARPGEPVLAAWGLLSSEVDPSPGGPRRALLFVTLETTSPR